MTFKSLSKYNIWRWEENFIGLKNLERNISIWKNNIKIGFIGNASEN